MDNNCHSWGPTKCQGAVYFEGHGPSLSSSGERACFFLLTATLRAFSSASGPERCSGSLRRAGGRKEAARDLLWLLRFLLKPTSAHIHGLQIYRGVLFLHPISSFQQNNALSDKGLVSKAAHVSGRICFWVILLPKTCVFFPVSQLPPSKRWLPCGCRRHPWTEEGPKSRLWREAGLGGIWGSSSRQSLQLTRAQG